MPTTITDEDIEYVVLLAILAETDLNTAIHAMFDMKGVHEVEHDVISFEQQVRSRVIRHYIKTTAKKYL